MIQDDNKIIFNQPQNFYRDTTKIKNDVIRKVITVNNKIQYYACVTDITYADGEITANLLGRDDEEYEISITAEISEGEVYPSYLAVDSTQPSYIQAVQIVILEGLRLLTDDDNTLPEAEEINTLQATITQLEKDLDDAGDTITTLTEEIETLTGQLEEAQSQTSSTGVQDYQKFTVNNTEYNIRILGNDTSRVFFMFYTDDLPVTSNLSNLGFSSQQGAALFKNTTDNTSIQFELYIDGTLQSNAGGVSTNEYFQSLTTNPAVDFTADKPVCVKITIKDSSDEVVSTAYDQFTYTTGGGGSS